MNKYKIFGANADSTTASLVGLAQQKRFAFKEKVMFYADEKRDRLAFTFRAEKVLDVHGRYFIEDTNGNMIGMFKKEFVSSLVNSTWKLMDKQGNELFIVRESNQTIALLRRFIGEIPLIGMIGEMVMVFFKYHFEFVNVQTGQVVGTYKKTTLFRDHYLLSTTNDAWQALDWRVYAAMAVALDALQSR
ncbi:hypothetical protein EOL96_04890 [Candidatus Saccharibacteria bacterium]|nr:hypothetical protein [Candidatus Saccharibacteria bacterium]